MWMQVFSPRWKQLTWIPREQYMHITQKMTPRYGERLGINFKNVATTTLYRSESIRSLVSRKSLAISKYRILESHKESRY